MAVWEQFSKAAAGLPLMVVCGKFLARDVEPDVPTPERITVFCELPTVLAIPSRGANALR